MAKNYLSGALVVSRSQTAFPSFTFGGVEKGIIFVLKIPTFWGFYAWLLIGVKGQKRLVER